MAYDIGAKIGIDGEQAYRDSINKINTNMRTLGTELLAVTSKFEKNEQSTEALTAKNSVLTKQINEQKNKLSELSKGLAMATDKYGDNDKVTQSWQQSVNKATADLNNMEREVKNNNTAIDNFGKETEQATDKTSKFNKSLSSLGNGLKNIGGNVAKVAVAGVKAVTVATIAAGAGALKLASNVGKTADDLITLSNQTGIATKTLQELIYASNFVDVSVEAMSKGIVKITKAIGVATGAGKNYIIVADGLNVSVRNGSGQLKSSEQVFYDTIDALGKITNETERDIAAQKLFGKSFQELNPLIIAGTAELKRLAEEANKIGAVLSDDTLVAAGKFDDLMQVLGASAKGLASTLGVAVIPAVTGVVNSVIGIIPKITEAIKTGDWSSAGQAVSDGLNGLLTKITGALPGLATMGTTIISRLIASIVPMIPEILPSIIQAVLMLFNALLNILSENSTMLIDAGIDALMMLIDGLIEALPKLIDASIEIILALVDGLIENLPELIDASIKIIFALVDGLLELLPELIVAAIEIIVALAKGLIDALPKLIEQIPKIVDTIVKIIVENIPMLTIAAIKIILALAVALINNLPLIIESVLKIIISIAKALLDGIGTMLGFIPKLFKSFKESFAAIKWGELGLNIITGIVEGVKKAAKNLANSVVDAAKGALNGAKKFLGIHSPSTVMRDQVGKMIGAGMAVGITDSTKQVNSAMKNLNNQLIAEGTVNVKTVNKTSSIQENISSQDSKSEDIVINNYTTLDGKVVAKSTSRIQATTNRSKSRAWGVVPA